MTSHPAHEEQRWADGSTGYPFVDAAMLELKEHQGTTGDGEMAGNWAYFILTQLPAREDDRPGGGPRYTLPRYSPYLMATQVLVWGREHDPDARYVKKWISSLGALPPELSREPWRVDLDDFSKVDGAWTCAACTLENPLRHRRCDACGTRRPKMDTMSSEVYREPMVPPYPEESELCGNCGAVDVGWRSNGTFFCEACWVEWLPDQRHSRELPRVSPAMDPHSGWILVPSQALPVLSQLGEESPEKMQRKGGRWQGHPRYQYWLKPRRSSRTRVRSIDWSGMAEYDEDAVTDLISRIQVFCYPRRIRVKEFFNDFDPLRRLEQLNLDCGDPQRDSFITR
eukprot:Skav236803  [mRNA]  locus=scaffold1361:698122:703880:- [translate_table: standard]